MAKHRKLRKNNDPQLIMSGASGAAGTENGPDMINCGSLLSKTKDVSPSSIFRQMVEFGIL